MKPGTFTHTLAVIISSITSFFTQSSPAKILPAKEKMSKNSDRTSEENFSMLQTTTAFVPAREDPRRRAERYPWKKEIVTTVFWIGEQATSNNPVPNRSSSWDKIGPTATADSIIRIALTVLVTSQRTLRRGKIPFIVLYLTMTKLLPVIGRKRPKLYRGLMKPITGPQSAHAKAAGSPSVRAIVLPMRNGKTPVHFAPITGNTFSVTSGPNPI
jgi:hypothetical protein